MIYETHSGVTVRYVAHRGVTVRYVAHSGDTVIYEEHSGDTVRYEGIVVTHVQVDKFFSKNFINNYLLSSVEVNCGAPGNGSNSGWSGSTTFGSMANYSCNIGHLQYNGSTTCICKADGTWSGKPLDCSGRVCFQI